MTQRVTCCGERKCRLLGEKRKTLKRAQIDGNDPKADRRRLSRAIVLERGRF